MRQRKVQIPGWQLEELRRALQGEESEADLDAIQRQLGVDSGSAMSREIQVHLDTLQAMKDRFQAREAATALGYMRAKAAPAIPAMITIYLKMLRGCLASPDFVGGGDRYTRARLIEALGRIAADKATSREIRSLIIPIFGLASRKDPLGKSKENAEAALKKLPLPEDPVGP